MANNICLRCGKEAENPYWSTKWCNTCKEIVHKEQSRAKNAKIKEANQKAKAEKNVGTTKSINPYFLRRGKISMHGDRMFGSEQ